jgi:lipopolysaccharide export system protein LptA
MTKRELINLLEAHKASDDTPVAIRVDGDNFDDDDATYYYAGDVDSDGEPVVIGLGDFACN